MMPAMRRALLILWVATVILAGAMLATKGLIVSRVWAAWGERDARRTAGSRIFLELGKYRTMTPAATAADLRSRGWNVVETPVKKTASGLRASLLLEFTDPRTEMSFKVYFDQARMSEHASHWSGWSVPYEAATERAVRLANALTITVWAIGTLCVLEGLLWGGLRGRRRQIGQAMTGMAGLCILIWWISDDMWHLFRQRLLEDVAWMQLSMLALGLAIWLIPDFRTAAPRDQHTHCRCGYDLTGNESGICPECGQPVPWAGHAEAAANLQEMITPTDRIENG